VLPRLPAPPHCDAIISADLLKRLVAGAGIEPATYGL
jgi:hypothetical protein